MRNLAPWRTIRARLFILVAVAVLLANAIAAGFSLWQETSRYGAMKHETLFAAAQTLAAAAARGVAGNDQRLVYESIRAIGRINGLTYVGVDDASGRHIADLGATEQLAGDLVLDEKSGNIPLLPMLTSRSIELSVPIIQSGEAVGRLMLMSDTADLAPRLWQTLMVTLAGMAAALVLALIVALRMQASITRPLTQLTQAMARVSDKHDYSLSLHATTHDEVGVLVGGFNAMLMGIRERDGKLEKHREHLEQEVADRTHDLVVARDAAQSANEQKSDFLATMSHEIRTPMNGMLVMAELLASSDLPDRSKRYAQVISSSGQSLLAIINDILDFSKIEAGKLELERLGVDPVGCVDNVLDLFFERAQSKKLDLATHIAIDVPALIEADPVRLNQVLGNLVNNALKFTESGGVTLGVARDAARPGHLRFSITDTGIGIPADKLAAVFDAFSQADQTTTRRFGGTGLGLSICRRLVAAMGGEIEVTSEVGRGSTFAFSIPCIGADAGAPAWPRANPGARALVCIAAPLSAQAVGYYLEQSGFEVTRVCVTKFALQSASADLVVADAEALEAAALPASARKGKALALTRFGEANGERCLARGFADALLGRPVSRSELAAFLERLASGAPLNERARSANQTQAQRDFSSAKVLVADDSAVNREVAIEALSRFGIAPDLAENGAQAIEACARASYDLVLMDGSMPDIDGFEAARRIRADEQIRGVAATPIVALTAHVVGAGSDAWQAAGMDDVLHKPFTISKLGDILARFVSAHGKGAFVAEPRDQLPVLDPTTLGEFNAMAKTGFVGRVIALYRDHAPQALAEIERESLGEDLEAIGRAAHALKSMSLNIGARRVAAAAADIENCARGGKRRPDREAVALVARTLAEALDALEALRIAA